MARESWVRATPIAERISLVKLRASGRPNGQAVDVSLAASGTYRISDKN
jgi:hypothetical protein